MQPEPKATMPRELTAENGAKALLIGEFFEEMWVDCPVCHNELDDDDICDECCSNGTIKTKVPVSWTTIKAIYRMAVEYLSEPIKE